MFDHIGLTVRDIAASARFYEAALRPLGLVRNSLDDSSAGFGPPGASALWLTLGSASGPVHVAFVASGTDVVAAFHRAGLAAGGQDNGAPGPRPAYGPTYHAAFLLDPDGNNVEAVCQVAAG